MSMSAPGNAVVVNFFMRFPILTPVVVATAMGAAAVTTKEEVKPVSPVVQVAPVVTPPPPVVVKPVPPPVPPKAPPKPTKG